MIFETDKTAGVKAGSGGVPSADDILGVVKDMGLVADDVKVEVKDGEVKVTGKSETQEALEKFAIAAANVVGVSKVDATEVVVQTSEPNASVHVVERGDTLWAIAQKTLGNGNRYNEIFEANKPMLKDPDKIYPGQILRIPPA